MRSKPMENPQAGTSRSRERDELVVAAAAGDGAAHPRVAHLEDLPGVVAHAADQGRVELPAQRLVCREPVQAGNGGGQVLDRVIAHVRHGV
jgi:hypothetical protein